jgi:hypothetical protein
MLPGGYFLWKNFFATKNLPLCLFVLCFTSYNAQARELALGNTKLT